MKYSLLFAAGLCLAIYGCSETENRSSNNQVNADSMSRTTNNKNDSTNSEDSVSSNVYNNGSSSAAVENREDTVHKFVRTADLKFKVKNVESTTYRIEDITNRHGGFVTYTNLISNIDNVSKTAISADSTMEITHFTVTNTMTIRVPNTQLDTTLKDIAALVGYLDSRVIKADDVSLQLLSNKLTEKRLARQNARVENDIATNGKKLPDITEAEESLTGRQEAADNAGLATRSLKDQVQYSTVQLAVYQNQGIASQMVATEKEPRTYEPGFGTRMLESLEFGVNMLSGIFLVAVKLWAFIMLGIIAWILYKKYGYIKKNQ